MKLNAQLSTGKKLAVAAVSLVVMSLAIFSLIPEKAPTAQVMGQRVDRFAYAVGAGLADFLASSAPHARVRVLLHPHDDTFMPAGQVADGLEAGLRGHVQSVERVWVTGGVVPSVENAGVAAAPEPSVLEDDIGKWEADTDLMVLLFDPPPSMLRAREESAEARPALAVVCPNVSLLLEAIEKGVISAAVAAKPDASLYKDGRLIEPPEDPLAVFALGFEVVTPQNVGAFKQQYPQLVTAEVPQSSE